MRSNLHKKDYHNFFLIFHQLDDHYTNYFQTVHVFFTIIGVNIVDVNIESCFFILVKTPWALFLLGLMTVLHQNILTTFFTFYSPYFLLFYTFLAGSVSGVNNHVFLEGC